MRKFLIVLLTLAGLQQITLSIVSAVAYLAGNAPAYAYDRYPLGACCLGLSYLLATNAKDL